MPDSEASADGEVPSSPATDSVATRDVFISYASQDDATANAVVHVLERHGINCWIAPRDVAPGALYADEIINAINRTQVVVLVLSESAIASPHVRKEVERASSKGRGIVTLRTDAAPLTAALEYFLSESQWIDLGSEGTDAAFARLVEAVRRRPTRPSGIPAKASPARAHLQWKPAEIRKHWKRVGALATVLVIVFAWYIVDKSRAPARDRSSDATTAAPLADGLAGATPGAKADAFAPPPHSIAVLPFVNMSGDPSQDYFSDGISEELLNALARISELQVAARTSSFSFKGKDVDIPTIAHKLNVAAVLEGSVRRAGSTVRITAQLINAVNGFHLWSQTYDKNLADILKLQSDVATSVAQQLKIQLVGEETRTIELGGTRNPDAYDAFLRGVHLLLRGDTDEPGNKATVAAFDQAIALDPSYALAYSGRAAAVANLAAFNAKPGERARLREQAREAAERGVTLAPELGKPHLVLAQIRANFFWDYAGAARELNRAIALEPGSASVQSAFASIYSLLGRSEAAIEAAHRAVLLDSQDVAARILLGQCFLEAHRFDEALAALQDAKAFNPGSHHVQQLITLALLASGHTQQARQQCESPSTALDEDFRHHCLALAYHKLGSKADADRELAQLKALNGDDSAYGYAQIYAQRGDNVKALQWLSKAERLRLPSMELVRVDWQLDPIRDEPQFKLIEARTIVQP